MPANPTREKRDLAIVLGMSNPSNLFVRVAITSELQLSADDPITGMPIIVLLEPTDPGGEARIYDLLSYAPITSWRLSPTLQTAVNRGWLFVDLNNVVPLAPVTIPTHNCCDDAVKRPDNETLGDMLVFNGATWARLAAGPSGYVLTAQGIASIPAYLPGTASTYFVVVPTIAVRDAIPGPQRFTGMQVYVTANSMTYRWDGAAWVIAFYDVDPATTTLYVDPQNGNDENAGTVGAQLKNVKTAVYKFLAPHRGARYIPRGTELRVEVKFTVAMDDLKEMIEIPFHTGEGVIHIHGEEEIVHTGLIENGGFTSIAGRENRRRITLTTSPLTPGALNNTAFLTPTNRDAVEPNLFQRGWEDLPIAVNTANTLDVSVFDPGIYSAFHYGNGVSLDVVRPRIPWTYPAPVNESGVDYAAGEALITPIGGAPLIVSGFFFKPQNDSTNILDRTVLHNSGGIANPVGGNAVILNRCVTLPADIGARQFWSIVSGSGAIYGCLIKDGAFNIARSGDSILLNTRYIGDVTAFTNGQMVVAGLDADLVYYVELSGCAFNSLYTADHRGGAVFVDGSYMDILAYTAENVGSRACINVGATGGGLQGSAVTFGDATRVSGSTGNTDVGCRIGILSVLVFGSGATISGTAGQLKVGSLSPQTFATGPTTDTVLLARYEL